MEPTAQIEDLRLEVDRLRDRTTQIERHYEVAPRMPRTNVISETFLKRAFAVWGHSFVASLIIAVPFYVLMFLILSASFMDF